MNMNTIAKTCFIYIHRCIVFSKIKIDGKYIIHIYIHSV